MPRLFAAAVRFWSRLMEWPAVLATTIIVGWLIALSSVAPAPGALHVFDQPVYLSTAYDLVHLHRFTDGSAWATPQIDPTRPPGMARTPLYPAFLAGAALLDPVFRRSLECYVQQSNAPHCPQSAPLPRLVQFMMIAAVYLMLWRIAARASGSNRVGWLSLGLGLLAAPTLLRSVDSLMTEAVTLFFITAATGAAVEAAKARRPLRWLLVSGLMVGLTALARPEFEYLVPAAVVAAALMIVHSRDRRRGLTMLVTFLLGCAVVLAPWVARNALVLGKPALTSEGYSSLVLAPRVAFDLMTWRQYGLFYVCALPDGTGIGSLLFGPGTCVPFGYDLRAGTFYDIGTTTFMETTTAAAGGRDHVSSYLLHHYVLTNPVWHAMVSIPMAIRGMWINHYWGLILGILCVPLTARALWRCDPGMLAVTLPGWFMLALHAALSSNVVRYNLMLVIPFAMAGGVALDRILQRTAPHSKALLSSLFRQ